MTTKQALSIILDMAEEQQSRDRDEIGYQNALNLDVKSAKENLLSQKLALIKISKLFKAIE